MHAIKKTHRFIIQNIAHTKQHWMNIQNSHTHTHKESRNKTKKKLVNK